jgi:hypothetical protein
MKTQWKPRQIWTRSPVQRAHSDHKSGKHGYSRADTRKAERRQE